MMSYKNVAQEETSCRREEVVFRIQESKRTEVQKSGYSDTL